MIHEEFSSTVPYLSQFLSMEYDNGLVPANDGVGCGARGAAGRARARRVHGRALSLHRLRPAHRQQASW